MPQTEDKQFEYVRAMSIFQTVISKYKASKQKSLDKERFKKDLLQAVSDGKLTKEEIDKLNRKRKEFGLSENDIDEMRIQAFTTAFASAKADEKVTKKEEQELLKIQKYLGISDVEIQSDKKELNRLRLLYEIQQGNIPSIQVTNLVMQKNEKAYWKEPAILAEERVISRHYEGGSRGMSFRVMKGVSYRVGSYRGHPVSKKGIVPVSVGELIITNKRLIFRGDKKSLATKLDKILDIQLYTNGLFLSLSNRVKQVMIKFAEEGNHHIIGAVMSYAINHYGDKSVNQATENKGIKETKEPAKAVSLALPHGFKSLDEMISKAYKKHLSTKGVFLCEDCNSDKWGILKMGKSPYNFESIFCQECGKGLFSNDIDKAGFNSFVRATNS